MLTACNDSTTTGSSTGSREIPTVRIGLTSRVWNQVNFFDSTGKIHSTYLATVKDDGRELVDTLFVQVPKQDTVRYITVGLKGDMYGKIAIKADSVYRLEYRK